MQRWRVVVAVMAGLCGVLVQTDAAGAATAIPNAVQAVAVTAPESNTTLNVRWVRSASGPIPQWYVAQAYTSAGFAGQAWCFDASCSSVNIPGLAPGRSYTAIVWPATTAGYGGARTSLPFSMTSGCADGDLCATVNVASTKGTALLRAQGFQNGQAIGASDAAVLRPQFWRVGVTPPDYTLFDSARASGAKVIALMSDAWFAATYDPATSRARAPWIDWNAYRAWVRTYAKALINSGHKPDYWDVQNEAGLPGYLTEAATAQWTPINQLEQYAIAYQEIRALDPAAKLVGPSIATFTVVAGRPLTLDLKTFLDYVKATGIQLGAIAWHEVSPGNYTGDTTALPVAIAYHVDTVRSMIAARNLGNPEILITEYGAQEMHLIPGWTVGYLTNLEKANVDGANRTCWVTPSYPTYNECASRSLGGLLTGDGTQRLANYWVHAFYGSMRGSRVATRTSTASMSTYAVTDSDGTVRVLLGRHEQCTPSLPFGCALGLSTPTTKNVTLDVDAAAAVSQWRVTVNRIPSTTAPMPAPTPVLDTVMTSSAGRVHIPLTAVNDGDALTVTLTPVRT